jgi:hypothetical protein
MTVDMGDHMRLSGEDAPSVVFPILFLLSGVPRGSDIFTRRKTSPPPQLVWNNFAQRASAGPERKAQRVRPKEGPNNPTLSAARYQ